MTLPIGPTRSNTSISGRAATAEGPRGRTIRTIENTSIDATRPADPRASSIALATRRAVEETPNAPAGRADLRSVQREHTTGSLVVFVVDASGSMGVEHRMAATKTAIIGLLDDAYRRRCRVAVVSFRGDGAETVLRPTGSVEIARTRLAELRTGGTSPIAAGLAEAGRVIDAA
ncbi:MAG: VWA domain-containing protein, partial [Acidimicrobiia bacterium]